MRVARAALPGVDVILEIAESLSYVFDRANCHVSERCAAKIGVKHDACGVDHAPQRRPRNVAHRSHYALDPVLLSAVELTGVPRRVDGAPDRVQHDLSGMVLQKGMNSRVLQQEIDARQVASGVLHRLTGGAAGGLTAGLGAAGCGAGVVKALSLSPVCPSSLRIRSARTRYVLAGASGS